MFFLVYAVGILGYTEIKCEMMFRHNLGKKYSDHREFSFNVSSDILWCNNKRLVSVSITIARYKILHTPRVKMEKKIKIIYLPI